MEYTVTLKLNGERVVEVINRGQQDCRTVTQNMSGTVIRDEDLPEEPGQTQRNGDG